MTNLLCLRSIVAVAILVALGSLPVFAAGGDEPQFTITTLQTLPDYVDYQSFGINNGGQSVGYAVGSDGKWTAVLWQGDGGISPLDMPDWSNMPSVIFSPTPPGEVGPFDSPIRQNESRALRITEMSYIAGTVWDPMGQSRAIVWNPDGSVNWYGDPSSTALGAYGDNMIVGTSGGQAVMWDATGTPTFVDPQANKANAVNSNGHIVGLTNSLKGFFWDGLSLTELPALYAGGTCEATDLNDFGFIVGASDYVDPVAGTTYRHACFWNGTFLDDLVDGTPYENMNSRALAVNNNFEVLLSVETQPGVNQALLWLDGTIYEMDSLIQGSSDWTANVLSDINDPGELSGYSSDTQGAWNPVKWQRVQPSPDPVPEAGTVALASMGLACVGYVVRKRR